ncbi:MAG: hypothetical protein LC130_27190 [Bryobacterales bacterium]|nr:hypothetical protein [Bryobacterales bacterium]
MAPGAALELPRLRAECLDPFRPQAAYSGGFTLARNLLLGGIGSPDDWERSNGDPVNFMLHTAKRTAAGFDQRAIDGVAHTNIVFGTYPSISGWREPDGHSPNRVFVAVEATHISIVYLRETCEVLAKADPRLPATFYRMLLDGISQWILCYDESAAASYYEYRLESYEEAMASGEAAEGLEKPQTIDDAKGPWLSQKFKPWPTRDISDVVSSITKCPKARRIVKAAAHLVMLSRKRKRRRPDWKVWDECFPNGAYTIPFSIIAFHEQDLVCEAFQFDEQDWLNSGEESSPAFFSILDPSDLASINTAFDDLRHFLSMMEALGRLFALLPGADLLEVES